MISLWPNARAFKYRRATWVIVLSLFTGTAFACERPDPADAQKVVRTTIKELFTAFDKERPGIETNLPRAEEIVDNIVSPHVDLVRFARLALGKHWRRASREQRRRFLEAFRVLAVRTYASALSKLQNASSEQVIYLPVREIPGKRHVVVKTSVPRPSGSDVRINYRMRCTRDEWKLFDLTIEGISLATTYRGQFSAQLQGKGFDGLIQQIANRNQTSKPAS